MSPETARRAAGVFYLGLAAATAGWWTWLLTSPSSQALFFPPGTRLATFLIPDLIALVGLAAVTGVLVLRQNRWAPATAWVVTGAAVYATISALALNWPVGTRPMADIGMLLACAGSLAAAWLVARS